MTEIEVKTQLREQEDKLVDRYSKLSKIFLLLGFILVIWAIIVFLGARVLNYGYDWAGLSVQDWIVVVSVLLVIFILMIIIFYIHYVTVKKKIVEVKPPKVEIYAGKKVHVFTHPKGMEGGIFSKTYIEIDEDNILRLRALMVPPEKLWGKK
jgi:hypothetical protein